MHREFLRLLEKAKGRSEYIIAVNLDIRGFTHFCQSVESVNVATYITKIYSKIINDYFGNASYYKPTGDGLIIIIPFTEENLKEVTNSIINSCLDLLEKFGSLCINEPMINYDTPQKIGIGLTRGSACCITAEDKFLDYSGRILNLASRLMDLARPSGIVFDDSFGIKLLKDEIKKLFSEDIVYLRGVAEEDPIRIYYTDKHTLIPDSYHYPLKEPKWNTETYEYSIETLESSGIDKLELALDRKPLDEKKITIAISHDSPSVEELRIGYDFSIDDQEINYERKGNTYRVLIDVDKIIEFLERKTKGIPKDTIIRFDIVYPIK